MFEVGFSEILLIFAIALLVLGPNRLPKLAADLGRWAGRARAMARQLRTQLEQEVNFDPLKEQPQSPNTIQPSSPPPFQSTPPASTPAPAPDGVVEPAAVMATAASPGPAAAPAPANSPATPAAAATPSAATIPPTHAAPDRIHEPEPR